MLLKDVEKKANINFPLLIPVFSTGGWQSMVEVLVGINHLSTKLAIIIPTVADDVAINILNEYKISKTSFNLVEIEISEKIEKGNIYYFTNSRNQLLIQDNQINSVPANEEMLLNPNNNILHTAVESVPRQTIALVLSGIGIDGVQGISSLIQAGGFSIVQQPSTAKYSGLANAVLQIADSRKFAYLLSQFPTQIERIVEKITCQMQKSAIGFKGKADINVLAMQTLYNSNPHVCFLLNNFGVVKDISCSESIFLQDEKFSGPALVWDVINPALQNAVRQIFAASKKLQKKETTSLVLMNSGDNLQMIRMVCEPLEEDNSTDMEYLLVAESFKLHIEFPLAVS